MPDPSPSGKMVLASFAAAGMGDAYLLPAIASVVLGGASILSVVQMPEAGRQIIYGVARGNDDASPRHNFAWAVWSGTPRVGDPWLRFAGKPERKPMQLALFEEGK